MTIFGYNPKKQRKIGDYTYLITVNGAVNAEFLKGYLISNGIDVNIFKEAISSAYPVNISSLGDVDIYVSDKDMEIAEALLKELDEK